VKKVMHERKAGTLRSGKSGKKVTSRKQAIAIGLSEARKAGATVPKKKTSRRLRELVAKKQITNSSRSGKLSLLNKVAASSLPVDAPPLSVSRPRLAWRCLRVSDEIQSPQLELEAQRRARKSRRPIA